MDNIIKRVNTGEVLDYNDAHAMFCAMADGGLTDAQTASILISMRYRGESPFELAALLNAMNKRKTRFDHAAVKSIDTCGTGGDGKSTVNVSTAVGIILASMGYNVVKHGNSAQSGKVGSADILARLGFDMDYPGTTPEKFFIENGFVFMFAPRYHPALKGIGRVRREIKVPTIFNYAGPLLNPAEPDYQVIGINRRENLELAAEAARICGRKGITFYSSFDGYDEVSSSAQTECLYVDDDHIDRFIIDPADFFTPFAMPSVDSLETAEHLLVEGLAGRDESLARIFAVNTALALKTMKVSGLKEGYHRALSHIISGSPLEKLRSMAGGRK